MGKSTALLDRVASITHHHSVVHSSTLYLQQCGGSRQDVGGGEHNMQSKRNTDTSFLQVSFLNKEPTEAK